MAARITAVRIGETRIVFDPSAPVVPIRLDLDDATSVVIDVMAPQAVNELHLAALDVPKPVLALGQKVPPQPEVFISGAIVKPVKRDDPEFAKLVLNGNTAIVFKNEEGTAADRMMTPRLKEKLDALAGQVGAEWTGTKLRVTEAWDEQGEHAAGSLHYEGRAADLTTAPLDGTKLGRLAQLAVDAGFDWVFFENASHVHASVRKE